MKTKIILLTSLFLAHSSLFAQENELPESGNVGIGTTAPTEKLDVRGGARIDSTLTVGDSLLITNSARVGEDLRVSGNAHIEGNLNVNGGITFPNGPLNLEYLTDSLPEEPIFLTVDDAGNVKSGGDLKSYVYTSHTESNLLCKDDNGGNTTPAAPIWLNGSGKIYTSRECVPDVKVGIGQNNPDSKLHITTALSKTTHPIIVDKKVQGQPNYKLMQLDNSGLLYAREIKVNLDSWSDYVFDSTYVLMPLEEVKEFIATNKHLPHVPSEKEMVENGDNMAETDQMLMRKVEELTLYMIQMQDQLKQQQELLQQQQLLIRELKETSKN